MIHILWGGGSFPSSPGAHPIRWGGSGRIFSVNCSNRPSIRVIQTCIVFCPNNVDKLPELMSTNCPNWGGQLPPPPPSGTPMITETHFAIQSQVTKRPNSTERLRVDATIMRCFQVELFSCFLLSSYAGHVNIAGEKPS